MKNGESMMMRLLAAMLALPALSAASVSAQEAPNRFDPPARFHDYAVSIIDPYSWGNVAASTLIDQIGDNPDTWGFSDRAASNAARFFIEVSIYHGVAALQDRSTDYYACECTGIPNRAAHAFAQAFTDYDRAGVAHVSAARIGAPYGSAIAEALWRPDRSLMDAVQAGSSSIVFTGLFNIAREFIAH
jgi:hypothetical protein